MRTSGLCWLGLCLTFTLCATSFASDYVGRPDVQAFISEIAERHQWDPAQLTPIMEAAVYQPTVIRLILPGTKATRSWSRYRANMVNATRINQGVQFWQENQEALARAEAETGVPAAIIVAILGVETGYGRIMGNFRLIDALTTLAFDYPRRSAFFRQELEEFLLLCGEQGWDPLTIKGSYAGAIGLPQFMPSSYRTYAVDYDNDGHILLFSSPSDAIGSVANYLKEKGWVRNGPIAEPVTLGATLPDTPEWQSPTIVPKLTALQLEPFSPEWESDVPTASFALIPLETPQKPTEYWIGFQNFYVITRYNKSSFYAMSVYQLAEAIKRAMLD